MSTEKFQAIVDGYVEAFDKADLSIIDNMFADDATVEDPVGSEVRTGKEAILAFYTTAFEYGAKLKCDQPIRVAGNSVAFAFEVSMGDTKINPIDVFEINDDGKVQTMRAYWGPENMG
ncbi:MAG: nuclear transport factor 2 family protein [Pseudomonadales bacterium]|nr:nuclear transport factor 2 family protein [Pseudomonadales bacterium]